MDKGVAHVDMGIQAMLQYATVNLPARFDSSQLPANFEQEREGEIIRHLPLLSHPPEEKESFLCSAGPPTSSDHSVPDESIWPKELFEDGQSVVHGSVLRDTAECDGSAHNKHMLIEAGSNDLGMYLGEIPHGEARLEVGDEALLF